MSPLFFYSALVIFALSAVSTILGACVLASRADRRLQEWMRERQENAVWEGLAEETAVEAEAFLARGVRR